MTPNQRADALMALDRDERTDLFCVLVGKAQAMAEDGDPRLLGDLEAAVGMLRSVSVWRSVRSRGRVTVAS